MRELDLERRTTMEPPRMTADRTIGGIGAPGAAAAAWPVASVWRASDRGDRCGSATAWVEASAAQMA